MIRLAQVELLPKRFVPQNNLINDCYYCVDENRQWYQFKDELIRAIRTCRCDYLDTRIETAFQHGAIKAYVLVIGKFDLNRIFTIDSVEVKLLNENVSTHTVLSMKKETILRQTVYPGQMQPDTNPDKYVDDIFKITSGTRGSFTLYGDWKKFLVVLELAGSTFLINNSGIQKTVPEKMFQAGSGSRVSFKLGLYSEKFPCARQKNENKPEIQFYSVRYFLNQCIADIQVKAAEGIAMVMFSSGSFEKIIRFNGEKELNSSIPLTAVFDSSAILTIKVSDRMGNVTVAKHPVFETLSDQKIKRQEAHDLKKKRDGWVEKNAVNKTLDVISKLDGNPLSWIVN
ncbi:MAG: hypothetical protein GX640_24705, partial [Fibrobacter sp.]|nr:hypothetical protein [Fibrobacter sp.]